ncbi:antibiotic biosynthesis monooxygenase [Halomonas organivorans]
MYCIIVQTRLKPGTRERFLEAMLPNAEASVRDEPGCHAFDVIEDRDTPDLFHLYEIYTDQQALAAHKETPHYQASRAVVNELIAEQQVIRADVLATNPPVRSQA